ncbi:M28 family peptidase [Rhodococcus chondri]|uniref:M28 family peptidase n=1 Tax=Rhodococcus chondri TaxID=3065941 RepID=A0ABU7JWG5_9NOCA|nr:M28 family peptidase [Rhodococcus sp. CC-R104]MEE2034117.1 M28 family peptidase [Rhodococcus sp. CC-R104]
MDFAAADARALPRLPSLIALLAVLLLGIAVLPGSSAPRGTDAPADMFSAGRAVTHIEAIADSPRPLGSPGHAAAREYLVGALEDLGWRTSVKSGVGWMTPPDETTQRGARVDNIVAVLPGSDPTGTVVLAAHYDTVTGSPGAGDDGIGVGTVLETARAIGDGPTPRNDVMVLLTDGEENGLLGAHLFAHSLSPSLGPTVVLNHEARGNAGLPTTFRMTSPNSRLIDALARAPGASADSLTQFAFEALPNNTDFHHFAEAGIHAYDTAIASAAAFYHSPLDTPDRLSRSSLQQMGDIALTTARSLAGSDLATLDDAGNDVVSTVPWGLLHYPRWIEIAATIALAGAVAALTLSRIRRREATGLQVALAAGVSLVAAVVAVGAAWVPWWLAQRLAPGMASPVLDEPYRPGLYQVAAVIAALGILLTAYTRIVQHIPAASLTAGAFVTVTVLAVVAVPFAGLPAAVVLPALPAVLGVLVAQVLPARLTGLRLVAVVVGVIPASVLCVAAVVLSFDAGLVFGAPIAGAFVAVLFAVTLSLWQPILPVEGSRFVGAGTVVLVLACALVAGFLNRDGATAPRQERLWYALNSDIGQAVWASPEPPKSAWSRELLIDPPGRLPSEFPWRDDDVLAHGPATVASLAPPEVEVLEDTSAGGTRELRLLLRSARGAPGVGLWVDSNTATVHGATVDGHRAEPTEEFGFVFWAGSPGGIEVTLTLGVLDDEVRLRIADLTDDLTVVPGYEPPPERVVVQPAVVVTRTVLI